MRTILLSFSPKYYEILKCGEKIFEHRSRFCNEEVEAYIYLGIPHQKLVAHVTLGKRIPLSEWLEEYRDDQDTCERISRFMIKNNYAMPILTFQEIEPIDINEIMLEFPQFCIPRSYCYLNNQEKLFEFIKSKTIYKGVKRVNNFNKISKDIICIC